MIFFFIPIPDANISTKTLKNSASGKHLAWKKNLIVIDFSCAALQAPGKEKFGGSWWLQLPAAAGRPRGSEEGAGWLCCLQRTSGRGQWWSSAPTSSGIRLKWNAIEFPF